MQDAMLRLRRPRRRYVSDEVVLELAAGISEPAAQAVARRHRLVRLESLNFRLAHHAGALGIPDRRAVPGSSDASKPTALSFRHSRIISPRSSRSRRAPTVGLGVDDRLQYALAKLQLPRHTHSLSARRC